MSDSSGDRDIVEQLAEEFVERWRRGERPSVQEYTESHPDNADRIRKLFPAILLAENFAAATDNSPSAGPPKSLGEYRIIREIGRGGMGVVYEAVQEPLGRRVALKVLAAAGMADQKFRERFQREARAAARLHHTNIVPVYGVGEHDGVLHYAMQFIAGQGLDQLLREVLRTRGEPQALSSQSDTDAKSNTSILLSHSQVEYFRGVARIGLQVATALDYAHGQGVIHRDIKPSNLLMDGAGIVWVTDFGLAKTDDEAGLTHTGDFVGTMRYMAPERFRGDSGAESDIYSLGVTLYEMLTFRPAFDDTDRAKLLDHVLRQEPSAPRSIDRRIPRDLETIVLKSISKDLKHRYPSAQALADDLHQFLADRPITARRARWTEKLWRWCRRNPMLAGLTSAVVILLLVVAIGSPIMSLRLWEQKQDALAKLWLADIAQAKAQRLTQEAGRRALAVEALDGANRILPSLKHDPSLQLELRNQFFACLSLPDLAPNPRLPLIAPNTTAFTFDSTFKRYARGDENGGVSICRVDGAVEEMRLPDQGIGAWGLKFSPDGQFIAVGYHRKYQSNSERFRIWNTRTGEQLLAVDSQTGCGEVDFSPDSRHVAFGRGNDELAIHDMTQPGMPGTPFKVPSLPNVIAFHPDGTKLAVACGKAVEIRERENGRVVTTRTNERDVWGVAWHPDGHVLATASSSNIVLWSDDNPQAVATLRGHEHLIGGIAFDPRGELLASKSNDGSIRLWDISTRRQLVKTPNLFAGCVPLQFSPDGKQLAFASDGARIQTFEVIRGHECRLIVPSNAPSNLLALTADFTPDGRYVAVANSDGVRIWNCESGEMAGFTALKSLRLVRFAGDGKSLYTGTQTDLQRWTIDSDSRDALKVLRPESLNSGHVVMTIVPYTDGSKLVVRFRDSSPRILSPDRSQPNIELGEHPRVKGITVSPDGKLIATGNEFGSDVRIWSAADGKLVKTLPINSSASVEFSPNGRLLVVGTESKYTIYDVATWQPLKTLEKTPESTAGDISFSLDGSLMVVRHSPNQLRILNPNSGVELATLSAATLAIMSWHRISPDGGRIAAAGAGNVMYLWDLAAIRKQLSERGLNW